MFEVVLTHPMPFPFMCRNAVHRCFHGSEAWCEPTLHESKTTIVGFYIHFSGSTANWVTNTIETWMTINHLYISPFAPVTLSKCQLTILPCL